MLNGENNPNYKHGGYTIYKAERNSWRAMKQRCLNPNYWCYHRYGGRGIKIDKRWLGKNGFINFLTDMGKKPSKEYSLDRVDNNSDYTPVNCRWATQKEQILNSATIKWIVIDGVKDTIFNHCKKYGISKALYYKRIKNGFSIENAFKTPNDGQEKRRAIRRAEHEAKIKNCLNCGKRCNNIKAKFCSSSCFMYYRSGT